MSFHDFASSSSSAIPPLEDSFSPFPAYCDLPATYDPLQDDIFDSSFSFVNPDYFKSVPPTPEADDDMSGSGPSHGQGHEVGNRPGNYEPDTSGEGSTTSYPIPISNLSLVSPPPQAQPINYAAMPFSTPSSGPHHSASLPNTHGFHPYHTASARSAHRLSRSPPTYSVRPGSPAVPGFSPSGSRGASHQQSPSAVSPNLVSPISSVGSDVSPVHWGYSLPSGPSIYAGTPLSSMTNISNISPSAPGINMVANLPYHLHHASPVSGRIVAPVPRPRPRTRGSTTSRPSPPIKKEPRHDAGEDDGLSDDEDEDKGTRGGLGLSPATHDSDERVPLKSVDIKKARIESEQRRRDELREGFRKLKEALPQSNLRASKASLLDRSVAHIQLLTAANNSLDAQVNELKYQLEQAGRTNAELAIALNNRGGSGSPGSSGRAPGH